MDTMSNLSIGLAASHCVRHVVVGVCAMMIMLGPRSGTAQQVSKEGRFDGWKVRTFRFAVPLGYCSRTPGEHEAGVLVVGVGAYQVSEHHDQSLRSRDCKIVAGLRLHSFVWRNMVLCVSLGLKGLKP